MAPTTLATLATFVPPGPPAYWNASRAEASICGLIGLVGFAAIRSTMAHQWTLVWTNAMGLRYMSIRYNTAAALGARFAWQGNYARGSFSRYIGWQRLCRVSGCVLVTFPRR